MNNKFRVILTVFLTIILAIIGDKCIRTYAPEFLLISTSKIHTTVITIWQIQALFTSIIIAIITLALSYSKEIQYGKNLLKFSLFDDRFLSFSQTEVIFILFINIPINYYFIIHNALFSVLVLFNITFIGLYLIFKKTFSLILNREQINKKIKDNILLNYTNNTNGFKKDTLNNIRKHNYDCVHKNDIQTLKENITLLIELFHIENSVEGKKLIEEHINSPISELTKRDRTYDALILFEYTIKKSKEDNIKIQLDSYFFYGLFRYIKSMKSIPNNFKSILFSLISNYGFIVENNLDERIKSV